MGRYLAGLSEQPIFYIKIRVTFMSPGDARSDTHGDKLYIHSTHIIIFNAHDFLIYSFILFFYRSVEQVTVSSVYDIRTKDMFGYKTM